MSFARCESAVTDCPRAKNPLSVNEQGDGCGSMIKSSGKKRTSGVSGRAFSTD